MKVPFIWDDMAKAKKMKRNELLRDYLLLEKISKELSEHQKHMVVINKNIARKVKSDLKYGFIEKLDMVSNYMKKAQKEVDNAAKELKLI